MIRDACFVTYCGVVFSGGVSLARFAHQDNYVVSTGFDDKCVFQWRLTKSASSSSDQAPAADGEAPVDGAVAASARTAIRGAAVSKGNALAADIKASADRHHNWAYHSFAHEEAAAATLDEACDVPSSVGNVDYSKESDASAPDVKPRLAAVLGMGGVVYVNGSKSPMPVAYYCGSGQIVTCMGTLVFTYDGDRYSQDLWNVPEAQEIGCIAVSPDSRYVLIAEKPAFGMDKEDSPTFFSKQRIYAASTGSLLKALPGTIVGGVCSAAFSHDGLQLACLACDFQHSVTMYSTPQGTWKDAVRTVVTQIDSIPVTLIAFIKQDRNAESNDGKFQFATAGESALRFWKLRGRNATGSLNSNMAQKVPRVCSMVSIAPGQLVTGDAEGHLSVWEGRDCIKVTVSAHTDAISALSQFESKKYGVGLLSASSDNVTFWNDRFEVLFKYSIAEQFGKIRRPVPKKSFASCVTVDGSFRRLLITLESACIIEVALDSGAALIVAEGHSMGRLTAIAAHPVNKDFIVTAGADCLLKIWSVHSRRVIAVEQLHHEASALAFKRDGSQLIVATTGGDDGGGSLLVLNFNSAGQSEHYVNIVDKVHNVGVARINSLRFSPDEKVLAVCSSDSKVYYCAVDKGFRVKAVVAAHSGPVYSIDFSNSGKYARSFAKPKNVNRVEMAFTDLTKPSESGSVPSFATVKEKDEPTLRLVAAESWASVSAAAPEARGARTVERFSGTGLDDIVTFNGLCAAGYSDGSAKLFR
jgi:WD40 repeat protein